MMTTLVTDHAAPMLFLWVLSNQAGVPVPVVPALLAAGALASSAGGLTAILAVIVAAALCADLAWYSVGRWRGARTLSWFRRFRWASRVMDWTASLSPTRQIAVLISARFLPEANPVAAGLAGASRTTLGRYLLGGLGTAVIWAGTWTGIGYILGAMIM